MPLASFLLERGQVDEGLSRPGRCTDCVLVEACGLDTLLEAGHQSLADKGFLMHAHCTNVLVVSLSLPERNAKGTWAWERQAASKRIALEITVHTRSALFAMVQCIERC